MLNRPILRSSLFALLIVPASLVPADSAAGQLYRCPADDGSTIYSERPCSDDAEAVELEGAISSFGGASGNRLQMRGSERTAFVRMIGSEVKIGDSYYPSDEGLFVPMDGTIRLVPFHELRSLTVGRHPGEPCGNTGHLCDVDVTVETIAGTFRVRYEALRTVTVIIEDTLTDRQRPILVWFGDNTETNIRRIVIEDQPPPEEG